MDDEESDLCQNSAAIWRRLSEQNRFEVILLNNDLFLRSQLLRMQTSEKVFDRL